MDGSERQADMLVSWTGAALLGHAFRKSRACSLLVAGRGDRGSGQLKGYLAARRPVGVSRGHSGRCFDPAHSKAAACYRD